MTSKRILLCVTGLSPQIVTETLYALATQRAWIPDEVHVVTTATGAREVRLNLLAEKLGWFHRLVADYALPPIAFSSEFIHVLATPQGTPLEDIRTPVDNEQAADFITQLMRDLTQDTHTELHVSIAGGRKTMGYYLGYALSLYGRTHDQLSHVLVSDPYENNRNFYYPTPYEHPIFVRRGDKEQTYDAREARVELAEIPFVRLREGLPKELLKGDVRFSQAVAAAQCTGRKLALIIDRAARTVTASGESVKLPPKEFALLWWLAKQRLAGLGPVVCSKSFNHATAQDYLAVFRTLFRPDSLETERTEATLARGMESTWFSPAKTKLNQAFIRALGETGAQPYLVRAVNGRKAARFALTLPPEAIVLIS